MAFMGLVIVGIVILVLVTVFGVSSVMLVTGIVKHSKILIVLAGAGFLFLLAVGVLFGYAALTTVVHTPDGDFRVSHRTIERLQTSIAENDIKTLDRILDKKPQLIWYYDVNRKGIIESAAKSHNIDAMKCILEHGGKFDNEFLHCYSTDFCCFSGKGEEVYNTLKFMLENGAEKGKHTVSAVRYACTDGIIDEMDFKIISLMYRSDDSAIDEFYEFSEKYSVTKNDFYYKTEEMLDGIYDDK